MESIEALRERLASAARVHLGDELGERWSSMLTAGTRLRATQTSARPRFGLRRKAELNSVGWLGGQAPIPSGAAWPEWADHGPMAHVATLDCRELYPQIPDALKAAGFPQAGLLSFYYFDGQIDGGVEVVGSLFGTGDGARVVYTAADAPVVQTAPPAPVTAYREVRLEAEPVLTWPTWEHPALHDGFGPADGWDALFATLDEVRQAEPGPLHQIGGHPDPVQGPVELEVAYGLRSNGGRTKLDWRDPQLIAEARDWLLLAQFDTDDAAGFMWGDSGVLYFMMRREDLVEGAFERAGFTWQCG